MITVPADESVAAAAQWLADQTKLAPNKISDLCERFGISAGNAAQACTLARQIRTARRASD
jgi:hypothetical protein